MTVWGVHLIHHFGLAIDIPPYEAWLNNVYPPSMDQSEIGIYAIIHGRLFLNELHEVCNRWGNLGQQFLNDLFFWVWDKLDKK